MGEWAHRRRGEGAIQRVACRETWMELNNTHLARQNIDSFLCRYALSPHRRFAGAPIRPFAHSPFSLARDSLRLLAGELG